EVPPRLPGDRFGRSRAFHDHLSRLVSWPGGPHPFQDPVRPLLEAGFRLHLAALLRRCVDRPRPRAAALQRERATPPPECRRRHFCARRLGAHSSDRSDRARLRRDVRRRPSKHLRGSVSEMTGTGRARISPEVSMPTLTVEKELLELENRYWQAIEEGDL